MERLSHADQDELSESTLQTAAPKGLVVARHRHAWSRVEERCMAVVPTGGADVTYCATSCFRAAALLPKDSTSL